MKKKKNRNVPETTGVQALETELKRINHNERFRKLLRSTIYTLVVVAAFAVLVAVLFMPVLRIYGSSMNPTLNKGEIVVSIKGSSFKCGDVLTVTDMKGYEFTYTVSTVKHAKDAKASTLISDQYDLTVFAKDRRSGDWLLVRCNMG